MSEKSKPFFFSYLAIQRADLLRATGRPRPATTREDPSVIQSWLTGLNPELGDRVPLRLMRENDLETVAPDIMGAARAFLVGG